MSKQVKRESLKQQREFFIDQVALTALPVLLQTRHSNDTGTDMAYVAYEIALIMWRQRAKTLKALEAEDAN